MKLGTTRKGNIRSLAVAFVCFGTRLIRSFLAPSYSTYYPERHYMRGPGPKCRQRGYKMTYDLFRTIE
jgi:hypothetical protein